MRVIRFAGTFCAVSDREPSTPHWPMRLPNIRKPTSGRDRARRKAARDDGDDDRKRIFVDWETLLPVYSMRILRSFRGEQFDDRRLDDWHQRHV